MWQAHSSASLPESQVSVHCPKQCAAIDLMQKSGCTIGDSLSSRVSLPPVGVGGTVLSINRQQIDNSGAKNLVPTSIYLCMHIALQFSNPQAQKIVNFNESTNQAVNRQSFPASNKSCAFQSMIPHCEMSVHFERPQFAQFGQILQRRVIIIQSVLTYRVHHICTSATQPHYLCVHEFCQIYCFVNSPLLW